MADNQFRHNHYVPEWYQRRFLTSGQTRYHYLDLTPELKTVQTANGPKSYTRHCIHRWGPEQCFAEDDLYTMKWGTITNTDLERFFFGRIDQDGRDAVEIFGDFAYPKVSPNAFNALILYMSLQRLRTPKGLGFLSMVSKSNRKNFNLQLLHSLQTIYCAMWTECVWQIADASNSPTKLIISDHPVTLYNRECFPLSRHCEGYNDPDLRRVATHTYFPLSLDKILILTNRSWVRDPYQDALEFRPNPDLFRPAMGKFTDIQTERILTEQEVLQINFVTKKRALRFIAAGEREWLYPERYLRNDHWRKLGNGYLFMPEPRNQFMGGDIIIGYKDGTSDAFGAYGHKPWQKGYKDPAREERESDALDRFKAEWAAMHGPRYTAIDWSFGAGPTRPPLREDSQQTHERYLKIDAINRRRPGERQRRRKLKAN